MRSKGGVHDLQIFVIDFPQEFSQNLPGSYPVASCTFCQVEMFKGFGPVKTLKVRADSSAAIGIASRGGCGRVRHLETPTLRAQQALKDGRRGLAKVAGRRYPADLGTKHLDLQSRPSRPALSVSSAQRRGPGGSPW